jgi:hypothetical protein
VISAIFMPLETLRIFDPRRNFQTQGFTGRAATEAAKAIFNRYVAGDLTTPEMAAEIRVLNAREFGPIH